MMRHRLNNSSGESENSPSVNDGQSMHRVGFAGHMAANMVQELDVDGDKSLGLEETELSQEAFDGIDGDGDGLISGREIANGLRDRRDNIASALGLERPEGSEPPQPGEGDPHARHARRRQAMAAYQGSMSDLMVDVFEPVSSGDGDMSASTVETAVEETLDVAV